MPEGLGPVLSRRLRCGPTLPARVLAAGFLAAGILAAASGAWAQKPSPPGYTIDRAKGVDIRVDYTRLDRYGVWDDRNYQLAAEDLAYLEGDRGGAGEVIPAFFRVYLRKANPALKKRNLPYPRCALQVFKQLHGGFLIGGKVYDKLERSANGRLRVVLEDGVPEAEAMAQRFLAGDIRVTSPVGAAESAVAINPADRNRVIAGSNGPGGGQRMHYSSDGGVSWSAAEALPGPGSTCCDPTVEWSSDGSLAYTATLGNCAASCNVWFYRSSDNGQTWDDLESDTPGDPRRELTSSNISDKEYMHVDRHAGSVHQDNIYLTWHDDNILQFARSTDNGNTWSTPLSVSGAGQDGIGSDIATDKSGNIYYFWPSFGLLSPDESTPLLGDEKLFVRKSVDGGASFQAAVEIASTQAEFIFPIPSMDVRQVFVYTSADVDTTAGPYADRVYVSWTDSTAAANQFSDPATTHARIQVAHSSDGGATWTVTTPHETGDASTVDRWHQWLKVGSDGTVHLVFYDTRQSLPSRDSVDVYHSSSSDGGASWSAPVRLTAVSSPSLENSFEFGDYNGLDVLGTDLVAIYTDNRNEGGGAADSVDVYATGVLDCMSQVNLALPAMVVSDERVEFACDTITAGTGGYFIQFPGDVTFRAGTAVELENGFEVQAGALFSVVLGPVVD